MPAPFMKVDRPRLAKLELWPDPKGGYLYGAYSVDRLSHDAGVSFEVSLWSREPGQAASATRLKAFTDTGRGSQRILAKLSELPKGWEDGDPELFLALRCLSIPSDVPIDRVIDIHRDGFEPHETGARGQPYKKKTG